MAWCLFKHGQLSFTYFPVTSGLTLKYYWNLNTDFFGPGGMVLPSC